MQAMTVQPRLASAVMLLRDRSEEQRPGGFEVFMVRRVVQSEFMPDLYVFPGGSVSDDDRLAEQAGDICMPVAPSASDPEGRTALGRGVRAAAIRELFEEGNVLLAYQEQSMLAINEQSMDRFAAYRRAFNERKGSLMAMARAEHLQLATDFLAYFSHWITPAFLPKRFDTHFFLATSPVQQEALYDQLETSEGVWIQPSEALKRCQQQEFPLAFPTYLQLRELSEFHSIQEALTTVPQRYVQTHEPIVEQRDGHPYAHLPENPDFVWKL